MVKKGISLFLPCYNEGANIRQATHAAISSLREITDDYEVIIVDDGSKDDTGEIVDSLSTKYEEVRVVHHESNGGYGKALKSGFGEATKELVFYTDGDNQFDIRELRRLIPFSEEADIVAGYRLKRRDPLYRRINAKLYNLLLRLLFGLKIKDIDCSFKLYKRKIFDEMEIKSDGAFVDAEILLRARGLGCRVKQIGVRHYPRRAGKPSGSRPGVLLRVFKEIWKFR